MEKIKHELDFKTVEGYSFDITYNKEIKSKKDVQINARPFLFGMKFDNM